MTGISFSNSTAGKYTPMTYPIYPTRLRLRHALALIFMITGSSAAIALQDDTGKTASEEHMAEAAADSAPPRFFTPYKDNYLIAGQMRMDDGSLPFSGEELDIKFELGMTFSLFANSQAFEFLDPLRFGYSQRSWWNIAADSAPFTEHNYNPEVFWRFDQPERPMLGNPPFVDVIGLEHQSNGLSGAESRSWDRVYVQKSVQLLPRLSVNVKLWSILNTESTNEDIRDYLGSGMLDINFHPNDRTVLRVRAIRGSNSSKISYQADVRYHRPWLNSAFFISYYDGYGEALVNYNKKSQSLRAGLYFPLENL